MRRRPRAGTERIPIVSTTLGDPVEAGPDSELCSAWRQSHRGSRNLHLELGPKTLEVFTEMLRGAEAAPVPYMPPMPTL